MEQNVNKTDRNIFLTSGNTNGYIKNLYLLINLWLFLLFKNRKGPFTPNVKNLFIPQFMVISIFKNGEGPSVNNLFVPSPRRKGENSQIFHPQNLL